MSTFAVELDDRAVCLARAGRVLSCAPSAVFDWGAGEAGGTDAWSVLRSRPTATSTHHLGSMLSGRDSSRRAAKLVGAELALRIAEHPPGKDERLWIATPARTEAAGLESLFGVTRALSLPVDGFVDSAVISVAALALERNAVVLELGLHHAAATAIDVHAGRTRRRRTIVADRGGLIELYQGWLELISTAMVKRTRFDPLHDAATEQRLFDELPALAQGAAISGSTTAVVLRESERFEVTLSRDQFLAAARPIYRTITGLLHELRPAGAAVTFVVPRPIAGLPGLREEFEQFAGCELATVADGFAGAAASLLDLPERPTEKDSVRLVRRLPVCAQSALAELVSREALGKQRTSAPGPSHVLFDGRAYALGTEPLVVGRAPGTPRCITLPDGLAGVSRRHCTFSYDDGESLLLDHSTFGTFVNGERVAERVRIHAGDRVRLGEPGVELALIAVGAAAMSAS